MKTTKKIRLFDKYPRHPAAKEKLVQLQLKREDLEKAKNELLFKPKPPDSIEKEGQKLLQSEMLEIPPPPALEDEELERVYRELQIVDWAIAAQKRLIEKIEMEISTEICLEMKPAYAEKVRAIAEAAQKLAECARQERDFRESLTLEGVTLTFEALPFSHVGYSGDKYAGANIYTQRAKQAGYL